VNLAIAIGGFIAAACAVLGLFLQVKKQTAEQKAAEIKAAAELRKRTLREGYTKRSDEVRIVIDRVVDLLNTIIPTEPANADVDRKVNRAITILTDAKDGDPDAD